MRLMAYGGLADLVQHSLTDLNYLLQSFLSVLTALLSRLGFSV